METNHTTAENLNDLVFENRNKAYGAYAIRNSYCDNVSRSLFITLALTGSLLLLVFFLSKNEKLIPVIEGQVPITEVFSFPVDLTPETLPEKKIEKAEPPKDVTPPSDNTAFQASDDKKDVVETTNANAVIDPKGKTDGTDSVFKEFTEPKGNVTNFVETNTNEVKIVAEVMPSFNGNLSQFIRDHIHYPRMALDNGTSGTVVVQFIIEKDGSVDDIKILSPVPDGCSEEAVRVVKAMPLWKPGKNANQPVRVLCNLPVKFTIK